MKELSNNKSQGDKFGQMKNLSKGVFRVKITKIETLEIDLSGQNGLDLWRPIYVRIHTDEGISGMGEASLAYGTASEAIAPMIRILAERFLLGQDPNDTETLWEIMRQRSFWALGEAP